MGTNPNRYPTGRVYTINTWSPQRWKVHALRRILICNLGIGAATGEALADPFLSGFLQRGQRCSDLTPAQTIRHPPVQPASSLGPIQLPPHVLTQFRLKKDIISHHFIQKEYSFHIINELFYYTIASFFAFYVYNIKKNIFRIFCLQTHVRIIINK